MKLSPQNRPIHVEISQNLRERQPLKTNQISVKKIKNKSRYHLLSFSHPLICFQIGRGMRSFIRKYDFERAIIVNKSLRSTLQIGKTQVNFIPYTDLCLKEDKDAYQ